MIERSSDQPMLVVGYGEDEPGDRVLAVAVDLARRLRARVHVVHVFDLHDFPSDSDAADWEEHGAAAVDEHRRHAEGALAGTGIGWSFETCRGDPAAELALRAAERDALMIVVGTRGEGLRPAMSRLLTPSVSHGVIARHPCPVLIVSDSNNCWNDAFPHRAPRLETRQFKLIDSARKAVEHVFG